MHRDCKLDNLLIHFPNRDDGEPIDWQTVDLDNEEFIIKIADFGIALAFRPGATAGSPRKTEWRQKQGTLLETGEKEKTKTANAQGNTSGKQWKSTESMDIHGIKGYPWKFMESMQSMESHGNLRKSMESMEIKRIYGNNQWKPWKSLESMEINGIS